MQNVLRYDVIIIDLALRDEKLISHTFILSANFTGLTTLVLFYFYSFMLILKIFIEDNYCRIRLLLRPAVVIEKK